jgi:tetratricopeptide (TPR) repeat protein
MVLKAGVEGEGLEQQKYAAKLVELYPNDERAQAALGNVYFGQQMFEKAVSAYEKAKSLNPDFSPVYNQLGYSYRALNEFEKAETTFEKYIELIPDDPNPYDSYAELLLKMGKYDESIDQYKKALSKDPNFAASHLGIATNLNLKGDFDKARKQLETLLGMAQNDGQRRAAHFAMAVSYVYQGDMQSAIAEIETNLGLAKAGNDAAALSGDHLNLGNILLETGQLEKAAEHYDKSTEIILQSDFSQEVKENTKLNALYADAVVAAKMGNFDKAHQLTKDFKSRATENGSPFVIRQAHEAAGIVALEAKEFDAAINELDSASQQNPYNLFRLAQAYSGKGETDKAKSFCKKAATFNAVNSMNQAFVQQQAQSMLASM